MGRNPDVYPEPLYGGSGGAGGVHAATHTNGSDDIQDATAAQKGVATAAQITKLDAIEAGADVTPATVTLAAAAIADNTHVRGDGGVRGLQESVLVETDAGAISGAATLALSADVGTAHTLGIAVIHSQTADRAMFSHFDRDGASEGSLQMLNDGKVYVMCGATSEGTLYTGGTPAMTWGASRINSFTNAVSSNGITSKRWKTTFTNGLACDYLETASAAYAADDADYCVILTAATAAITLPDASTTGRGFQFLIKFTGATSRTITPAGGDTSDVTTPAQNIWTWLISDGVSNWVQIVPA